MSRLADDESAQVVWTELHTPLGSFRILAEDRGLLRSGFGAPGLRDPLWPTRALPRLPDRGPAAALAHLQDAAAQVGEYFEHRRRRFELPLVLEGPPFHRRVWQALQSIGFGQRRTYGELARVLGRRGGARAVGQACHHNPLGLLIPCHRVVGASGALTGYGGGLPVKRRLLEHESGLGSLEYERGRGRR